MRNKRSRTYEGLFLLDPIRASQDWDGAKKQITELLERKDANIISAKKWGERKLAYEIKGHKRGTYLLIYFEMPTGNLSNFKRDIHLQLSDTVLRHLILVYKKPIEKDLDAEDESAENEDAENGNEAQTEESEKQTSEDK